MPKSASDSATQMLNPAHRIAREGDDFVFAEESHVTAFDSEHRPSARDGGKNRCANDRIEAGRVAAAGTDCNSHVSCASAL